ncbi:deoxynucleoside triphosphate triphosphohydrolase SAMHD1-like isoform X2 [Watersipora subatra]|uniref:deoxynucleoside triphosphate triphosphohydrolase SAMHD1-like isoform X2 n=1 Tax=Watersipora subatra TaxID=2589382 RepID=UPI00355C8EA6
MSECGGYLKTVLSRLDIPFDGCSDSFLARFSYLESLTFLDGPLLDQIGIEEALVDSVLREISNIHKSEDFVVRDLHKLINDPVHGTINLHPLAVTIISSPQFQRLHFVKQLSTLHYIYPSAGYSRFEHSVGTYHLAGKLINSIKDRQPELKISAIDAMCVQLAGLCHDLGHGPFSHMFDRLVIPKLDKESKWTHEDASTDMVDYIWKNEQAEFEKWGFTAQVIEFIKSLILGKPIENSRENGKSFLYEIVANSNSGMDVDKWDYLIRDSYHLGIKCSFDPYRLIFHIRVVTEKDGHRQICYRDKEANTICSMFQMRYDLYMKAYHHRVALGVELQVAEAIVKANKGLTIAGKTLLECLDDMKVYTHLHDGILFKILESEAAELKDSRVLLERLQKRQIWKFIGEARITGDGDMSEDFNSMTDELRRKTGYDFIWTVVKRNFGKKEENPLDYIRFYKKDQPNEALELSKEHRLCILPVEFQSQFLRIYCTSPDVVRAEYRTIKNMVSQLFGQKNYLESL